MTQTTRLVCIHCAAINQFDPSRDANLAKCGRCSAPLIAYDAIDVSADNLYKHIEHTGLPVLVDFWAPQCGPCKVFAPTYQHYAATNGASIRCLKLDTETYQKAAVRYGIRSIPTLALFNLGKEIARSSGAMSEQQLDQWVTQSIGS